MGEEKFNEEFVKLNNAQKEAVLNIYGPVMVVAGPGTGKTQIIALRTANIILKASVNPENILITTFTEAGVIAIKKRLAKFLGTSGYKVTVSTIHSFAQDVIKTFPEKFVEFKLSTLIDEVDSLEVLKIITDKLVDEKKIEELTNDYDKYLYLRDIKTRINNLKQEGINNTKFNQIISNQEKDYEIELSEIKPSLKKYEQTKEKQAKHIKKLRELNIFYERYNSYLLEKSLYDFNDMINFVLQKFEEEKELRQYYAEAFQFIMLDEYQDTNNAQNRIIELILSENIDSPNIMVVGDDDQSIYRFQGANIENMLDFANKYSDVKIIVIEDNYRSNQAILDMSNTLIDYNDERLSKKIKGISKILTAKGIYKNSKNIPSLYKANSDFEEETYIVNKINSLINSGTPKEEIAIIVRQNKEVQKWSNLLESNNLEVESKLQTSIFTSPYVNYILDYLEIINDPYTSEEKLLGIMRAKISGLNSIDIFKINRYLYQVNYTKKFKDKIFDLINNEQILINIGVENIEGFKNFFNQTIELGKEINSKNMSEFFGDFLEKTGILRYIELNGGFADLEDIYTLLNKIKEWNNIDKTLSLKKITEKIDLYKKYNYIIPRQILVGKKGGIQIMTAHSSKGLEFNSVFIPGLYLGNWDSRRIIDKLKLPRGIAGEGIQNTKENSIEEDRRLFFVAITRAKENLFLSFPSSSGNKIFLESQFITEINGKLKEETKKLDNIEIINSIENLLKNDLITYSDLDLEYIERFLETYRLSPSDLNKFIESPLSFLHSVVFKYPFEDNKFTIFGKVYHRTLELFYTKYFNEKKLPDKSYLRATFKYLIDKEILSPEEYENALEKGIAGLDGYYETYKGKEEIPLLLEHSFRNKNLYFDDIPLTGTVDKIEKLGEIGINESNNQLGQLAFFKDRVALIDYKTGKIKTLSEIKGLDRYGNKKEGEGKYFRQLLFYKLLAEVDFEFSSKFDIGNLKIDFVEGKDGIYKLVDVDFTEEEYIEFKEELKSAWKQINNIEFWKELLRK